MNLAELVLSSGNQTPDKPALSVVGCNGSDEWSYARLNAAIRGTAAGLLQAGIRPADRVLMRLGNSPEFPIVYLAAITAGIIPVPTSPMLTATEITRIANTIRPALIIASENISLPDYPAPIMAQSDLAELYNLSPADFAQGAPDRLAYIIYTSGSSGNPRAVMHAHRAILARRMMFQDWYGLRTDDRVMHAGAFNWSFTLGTGLLDPWTKGATALIPEDGAGAEQLPLLAARHGATILAGAPGVFRRILRAEWPPISSLRHGLTAGERLDPTVRLAWQTRTGTDLHEAMGSSEISTFLSGSPARPAPAGTAGFPQTGRKIAILADNDQPVCGDGSGMLAVSRDDPGLFLGYLDQPEETAACFRGSWFLTGDRAQADGTGAITLLGRADDMMNAGGYRVAPPEIEELLSTINGAGEVAAVELPIKSGVTVIAAFWTGTAPASKLKRLAGQKLARYKQPREYIHLDALPRTATGKINRRALRQTYRKDIE